MQNETSTETDANGMPLGSTMTPSQVRKLKIAIAVMSVMLVAGFILLLVGIYMETNKLGQKSESASRPLVSSSSEIASGASEAGIAVPPGAEVVRMLVEDGQLFLHLRHPGGAEIAIVDITTGREIRRLTLTQRDGP